ncbi:major facilitator superfamily domain-containing protein [Rhypophila decipiens]|uniref:Major facilitator superfamily domain-containing protein n=1 Tax=Rhypophila decipiens TaxID=261697 RepID=A0AAN7B679_9PEZI|nr:major facilitator superfamily domain-containing protein [Rhypophila decipiens]
MGSTTAEGDIAVTDSPPAERECSEKSETDTDTPYSVFTKKQKLWISMSASFSAMFSTMSSYIYYPALVPVARDLGVSVALVNLSVTTYLIVAAISPALMGDMADQVGRRPIYMILFVLMVAASTGIALQTSYAALLVLRMVQSAGASALIAITYGVIADITESQDRGGYVGVFLVFTDIAPSMGPVLGGAITQQLGWRWVFWFLVIVISTTGLSMALFFPETQRKIVGNGSVKVRGIYWSFFSLFQAKTSPYSSETTTGGARRHWPNPFACLPILGDKGSLAVIFIYSITYSVKMTLQTSLGAQCVEIYNLDYLAAGLIYLPSGVAGGIGSFSTGRFLDWNYRKTMEKHQIQNETSGASGSSNTAKFSLEKTRLRGIYVLIAVSSLGTLGYGLALMTRTHISVMILMQFLTGMTTASTFTMTSTLLTDMNVERSATAQGACSIVRCLGAGAAIAAVQPLADAIGLGWCFAIYALLLVAEVPLVWLLRTRGTSWRRPKTPETTKETTVPTSSGSAGAV